MEEHQPLEFLKVSKVFRDFFLRKRVRALSDFNLKLSAGETLGLIGPNGSGKSTSINLLVGLLRPTSGSVRLFGRNPRDPLARRELGYLPEENSNYPFLTAMQAMMLHARVSGLDRREARKRCRELLERLGLGHAIERRAGSFSKGMGRRLGLAQALIAKPRLLVLDEPTSGLDPVGTDDLLGLLAELRNEGVSILVSSHVLSEIEGVCDRVVMLSEGHVIKEGATRDILTLDREYEVRFKIAEGSTLPDQLRLWLSEQGTDLLEEKHPTRSLADVYREVFRAKDKE